MNFSKTQVQTRHAQIRDGKRTLERGSTLTGYALIMTLITVLSLSAIQLLNDNSETLLTETGTQHGTPRPPRQEVVTSVLPPPPAFAATTIPPIIQTYVDRALETSDGCVTQDLLSGDLGVGSCGGVDELALTALSSDGTNLTIGFNGGVDCLGGNETTETVFAVPCPGGQTWQELASVGSKIIYELEGAGFCLVTSAGDPGLLLTNCTSVSIADGFTVLP